MAATQTSGYEADVQKLRDLIKGIRIAMLTTADEMGTLKSRPMATQEVEFDGDLWFLVGDDSEAVRELKHSDRLNLAYVAGDGSRYISIAGHGELVHDRAKIHEFWSPMYKAWFPNGEDDPRLVLIKVVIDSVEYWEGPSNKVGQLVGFLKARVTGQPEAMGEKGFIDLDKNEQVGA